ncbi:hypothetical protein [Dactylosporangium sp. NPDC051541]|uniref:hypothetical protein n=1 Tax=Dactylosporangium sp. NPDC051541 TaxID=3363977 RepID=UPI003795AEBD
MALLIAVLALPLTACSHPSSPAPVRPPADPAPVTVNATQATTVDLGGGAHLIIPPGAMTDGATVSATYRGAPAGNRNAATPASAPVELRSDPPDAIHGLLTLEFPVPAADVPAGADPTQQFGISTYDTATNQWTPFASTYDEARHMVVAQIPHFSWWNPFSWDWAGIGAQINQSVGQLVGRRAANVSCHSSAPGWVASTPGVVDGAGLAIRSCTQNTRGLLDVQIVNNRPYGQVLTYGSAVDFGWHADGDSAADKLRNGVMDLVMKPNQLYIPPLSAASVGIKQLAPNQSVDFVIGPTSASITADLLQLIAGQALDFVPKVGNCAHYLADVPFSDLANMRALRDLAVNAASCLLDLTKAAVAKGLLDKVKISQIETIAKGLTKGNILSVGWTLYGVEWQVADLFVDHAINNAPIRNGFTVFAKAAPYVAPTTQPGAPATNPPQPESTPPAAGPAANRTAVTSYNRMSGGAPYWGRSTKGWQGFTAASNTLTQVGVTWSNTNYAPGATLGGVTTRISLCQSVGNTSAADPCVGRIADGAATVINQADTRIDFGDIAVTPGATYYVFYYQPAVGAGSWDLYWWTCSCPLGRGNSQLSDQNQAIVLGYNR